MTPQDCPDYSEADACQLAEEHDKWDAGATVRALKRIIAVTNDAGVYRMSEIRRIAEEAIRIYEFSARVPAPIAKTPSVSINEPLPMEPWR